MMVCAVALLVALDIYVRAARAARTLRPSRAALAAVRRWRWTGHRMAAAGGALLSFYLTYLAYRNLKGVVPLLRPHLVDSGLADADRAMLGGHDPAALLHSLLGTSSPVAQVLSTVYVAFIVFLPLSLAVALVFAPSLKTSLLVATALSINWLIGNGSYLLLPSLGPAYADPGLFSGLPHSYVTSLQAQLMIDRAGFLRDPDTGILNAIAAFASLHVAMSFTALLTAELLRVDRRLRIALWVWMAATLLATVYLGWHYLLDDVAGLAIGAVSLALARVFTDYDFRAARATAG
jgi:membrane-associated phospholipid phosphatase